MSHSPTSPPPDYDHARRRATLGRVLTVTAALAAVMCALAAVGTQTLHTAAWAGLYVLGVAAIVLLTAALLALRALVQARDPGRAKDAIAQCRTLLRRMITPAVAAIVAVAGLGVWTYLPSGAAIALDVLALIVALQCPLALSLITRGR